MATYSKTQDGYTLTLTVTEKSRDVSSNTTTLEYSLALKSNASNKSFSQYNIGWSVSMDGTVVKSQARSVQQYACSANGTVTFFSGATKTISHNADGTKSVALAFSIDMAKASYTPGAMSGSGTMKLTDIPRASSVSATNANIGSTSTITITRASTSFTHKLYYRAAGQTGYTSIATLGSTTTSHPWTVPTSLYNYMSDQAKEITVTILCETYSGTTKVGDKTCTMQAKAVGSVTVNGTVTDVNDATKALTGNSAKLVLNASTALCQVSASATNGANIANSYVNGTRAGAGVVTFANVTTSQFVFSATDTRGNTNSKTISPTVVNYIVPTLTATVKRTAPTSFQATLTMSGAGFSGSFGTVSNNLTVKYRTRKKNGNWSGYTSYTPTVSSGKWNQEVTLNGYGYEYDYEVEVVLSDRLNTITQVLSLPRGKPVFDWGEHDFRVNEKLKAAGGLELGGVLSFSGSGSAAAVRNVLGLGNTSGALPIANGGTGATTPAAARTNLGIVVPETGSYTPYISNGTRNVGCTYNQQRGQYYRIGKLCFFSVRIKGTITESGENAWVNLPFYPDRNQVQNFSFCLGDDINTTTKSVHSAQTAGDSDVCYFRLQDESGTICKWANTGNPFWLQVSGVYITT